MADLSTMFGSGNPWITKMGMDMFDQQQAKGQTDIETARGIEQRAAQMQPLEMEHRRALTRQGNANAATVEDSLAAQAPLADRLKFKMTELHSKTNDIQRAQQDAEMYQMGQWAAMARANKGQLPLELMPNIPESARKILSTPQGINNTLAAFKAYHETHPRTLEQQAKQQADLERARIMSQPGLERARNTPAPKAATIPKMSYSQQSNYYNELARLEKDPIKKAELEAYADRAELMGYREKTAAGQARKEGEPDLQASGIQTIPEKPLAPTPRRGTPAPQLPALPPGATLDK